MSDETRNEDEALAAVVQKWRNMGHANRDDVSRLCDAAAELSSVRAEAERLRDGYGLQRQWADAQTERANQAVVERDAARAELAEVCALIERVALSWVDSRRESISAVELDCAQEILAAVGSGDTEPAVGETKDGQR